jgi:hypothetical protein
MADDSVNVSPTKVKAWIGAIAALAALIGSAWGFGGTYHNQFATTADLYTLAIQVKEDDLSLIEFRESVGTSTPEDQAKKSTIIRRLADLKKELEKTE